MSDLMEYRDEYLKRELKKQAAEIERLEAYNAEHQSENLLLKMRNEQIEGALRNAKHELCRWPSGSESMEIKYAMLINAARNAIQEALDKGQT